MYIGELLPNTIAKFVSLDDCNINVLPGNEGELCIKGPQVMMVYICIYIYTYVCV